MDSFAGFSQSPPSEYDTVICHVCHVSEGVFATIGGKNFFLV